MTGKNSKVRKINQGFKINAGFIIFAFVFIYIIVFVVNYLLKEQISIYEVTTAQIADKNSFSGLIIRDEVTVNTPAAGYVTYYVSDGAMVAVNDGLFSINEGAMADQQLTESESTKIRDSDYYNIRRRINTFAQNLSNTSFSSTYSFKTDLNTMIFEAKSGATTTNMNELISQMEEKGIKVSKSPTSALTSIVIDNMTNMSQKSITEKSFDIEKYEYKRINTGDLLEKDVPAIRLITSNSWSIAIKLDDKQYDKLKELTKVTILLNKYNIKTTVPIECFNKNGITYAVLSLDKYIANYVDERYLDVELLINSAKGLKIPNTSITEKDFYLVPFEYITKGGNSSSDGVSKIVYDKNGNQTFEFVKADIYYIDEENNCYLDSNLFEAGTVLAKPNSKDKFTISQKAPLEGVFIVNQGYFDFRRIEVIYDNSEYSIVSDETKYGLNVYDQIVSDATTADDEAVVY